MAASPGAADLSMALANLESVSIEKLWRKWDENAGGGMAYQLSQ